MAKIIPIKGKTASKTRLVKTIVPETDFKLPDQGYDEVQLINTDTDVLKSLAKPNDFREIVKAAKVRFIQDINNLSGACDLDVEVKVYFSFKNKEKPK